MNAARSFGIALALTGALTAVTACGSVEKASPSPTKPNATAGSAAATTPTTTPVGSAALGDYTYLLIQASDVGHDFAAVGPPTQDPGGGAGAGQNFGNPDHARTISDTIYVAIDPTVALQSESDRLASIPKHVASPAQSFEIGTNGWIAVGKSPDKSKAVTYLVFAEGKAVVTIEFDSAVDDPVQQEFVVDVARKQDGAVKSRLIF